MEKINELSAEFTNQNQSRILINFLKDKGFTYHEVLSDIKIDSKAVNLFGIENFNIPVYLSITFETREMILSDSIHQGFNLLDYEENKSKIYEVLFEGLGMGESTETPLDETALDEEEKGEHLMIRIQIPKNGAEQFPARKEITSFLNEYRVPLDKQHHLYLNKVYTFMMIDHNNKTYWFENDIDKTKSANISFHYKNNRNEILVYLEELTGYRLEEIDDEIERSDIEEKVDLAELKMNEFFMDVVELGYELKEELKETGEELFIDVKENVKGLTKRTMKNIMNTDTSQVKENLTNTLNQTKENITIFSKLIKRKIKNL